MYPGRPKGWAVLNVFPLYQFDFIESVEWKNSFKIKEIKISESKNVIRNYIVALIRVVDFGASRSRHILEMVVVLIFGSSWAMSSIGVGVNRSHSFVNGGFWGLLEYGLLASLLIVRFFDGLLTSHL